MSVYVADVFKDCSFHLNSFVGKRVRVATIHGKFREGFVFTIDPITESVVLVEDKNGKTSLEVIMRHIIKSVDIIDSIEAPSSINKLFSVEEIQCSDKEISKRKSDCIKLLDKHRIPYVEKEETLIIHDTLEILPPYGVEQCISNNTVILSRIKNLLASIKT